MPIDFAAELSRNEKRVLLALGASPGGSASGEDLRTAGGFEELVEVMNAASWLHGKGLVAITELVTVHYRLGAEGRTYVERELPERRALRAILGGARVGPKAIGPAAGLSEEEVKVAVGWLRKKRWAEIRKGTGEAVLEATDEGKAAGQRPGPDEDLLRRLADGEVAADPDSEKVLAALRGRGEDVVTSREETRRTVALTDKGRRVLAGGLVVREEETQLTHELLSTGRWKQVEFRPYDPTTFAPDVAGARLHPITMIAEERSEERR